MGTLRPAPFRRGWKGVALATVVLCTALFALPAFAHAASFTGLVLDAATTGPMSAYVSCYYWDDVNLVEYYDSTYTDDNGSYRLSPGDGMPATYKLSCSMDGYFEQTANVDYDGVEATVKNFYLQPDDDDFVGTVTNSGNGVPVDGACVEASFNDGIGHWYDFDYAGADGSYALNMNGPEGTYDFTVSKGRFKTTYDSAAYDGSARTVKDLELVPAQMAYQGVVSNAADGKPVYDAYVDCSIDDPVDPGVSYSDWAYTTEDGYYSLSPMDGSDTDGIKGDYLLQFSADRFEPRTATAAYDGANATTFNLALTLGKLAFKGKVTDVVTGAGLEDAYVRAAYEDLDTSITYDDYAYTTADGSYELRPMSNSYEVAPAASYLLTVQSGSGTYRVATATVAFSGTTATTKDFALQKYPAAFKGTVTDAATAKPLKRVGMSCSYSDGMWDWDDYAYTADDGSYALYPGDKAGDYALSAADENYGGGDSPSYFEATATVNFNGTSSTTKNFALQPYKVAFQGKVTAADTGAGLEDVDVEAYFYDAMVDGSSWSDWCQTDATGHYALSPGIAATYSVSVDTEESQPSYVSTRTDIRFDGATTINRDFVLQRDAVAFQGSVTDSATGASLKDVSVEGEYYDTMVGVSYHDWTLTDAAGAYALRTGRADAEFIIRARLNGYVGHEASVMANSAAPVVHNVKLQKAALIFKGVVTDAVSHAPIANARVACYYYDSETNNEYEAWDETAADGTYELRESEMPSATYQLTVRKDDYQLAFADRGYGGLTEVTQDFALTRLVADEYEPDNSAAAARAISVGALQTRSIYPAADEDWVTFTAVAGTHYLLYTAPVVDAGVYTDTYLRLFKNDSVTLIAQDDDGGPWGDDGFSGIHFTPDVTQQVRVKASGFNTDLELPYRLGVRALQAPVATDDVYTIAEGGTLRVAPTGILANDTDADGMFWIDSDYDSALHGTVLLSEGENGYTGGFTYVPNVGFSGVDYFTYWVCDEDDNWDEAKVTINVTGFTNTVSNDAPVVAADSYSAAQNQPLAVLTASGVGANDTDPDGDTLMFAKVANPAHGTVVMQPDGSFLYTPTTGYSGLDSFTYKANDGMVDSSVVTVSINVIAAAPVVANDSYTVGEDGVLTVLAGTGLLSNDTLGAGARTVVVVDPPLHGGLAVTPDGSFNYIPDANYHGTDSFTYKVRTGSSAFSEDVTVTLNVASAPETSVLTLTSTSRALFTYRAPFAITGRLVSSGGLGLAGQPFQVKTWPAGAIVYSGTTGADGVFSATVYPTVTTTYKVYFPGNVASELTATWSTTAVTATAKALVRNPVAPSSMSRSRYYTVYGLLGPKHVAGTYPVRIYKSRLVSGKWKSYGYVNAKASNYSALYSKYSKSIRLPYAGKWKLRALAVADAGHAATWSSGVDYVTVK